MSISQLPKKLKWHNTLPEDFNMQPALSASSSSSSRSPLLVNRKRHSTSFENIDPSDFSHTLNHSASDAQISLVDPSRWFSPSALHSPTKRQRPSSFSAKTPTKFNPLSGQSGNAQGPGSGMQTPPPSSTGTGRKRGKPLKGVLTSSLPRSRVLSPPQTSPTTPFSSTENLFLDQSELDKHHLIERIAGSELKIPISASGKPARFLPKSIVWDGALGYSTGLGLSTDDTEASASFDWSSLRRNSSVGDISDIFSSTPTSRPRDRLPSLPRFDDASDPVQYSFVQFGEPDGLPLDVDPNLLFSSSTSVASSMIGGLDDIGLPSLPYQHQHMQQKREQELEAQKERRLLERQSRLGRSQERILVASYKAPATGKENSRGSSSRKSLRSFEDDENVSPPLQFRKNMSRSAIKHRAIFSPVKGPKGRTQVTLSISPGGHAKTETTVIYSDSETEIDEGLSCAECNSPEESDSSFDHETPRGLAPDGRGYITFRRRISADPFLDTNPPSSTPKKTRHELLPRTPTRHSPFMSLPGSSAKVRAFAASTAAAATTVSSSPKLPTPIISSPAPRFSQHPLIGSAKRMDKARNGVTITSSTLGTSSTGYIQQEVGDESEAETVVDSIDINEPEDQEEDGDALTALRKAMTLRRKMIATNRATSPQRTPTKSRPGSAIKVYSNSVSRSDVRRNQAHPSLLSPVKKKLFQTAPTAQNRSRSHRRKPADGGFFHQDQSSANTSPTTITDPECSTPRALSLELGNDDDGTRCVCGVTDDDGGTTMVQCDSCNNWLHMRCLGYNSRKLLPVVFVCTFCTALTPGKNGRVTRGADKRLSMNTAMMAKKRPSSWPLNEKAGMSVRLHQNM